MKWYLNHFLLHGRLHLPFPYFVGKLSSSTINPFVKNICEVFFHPFLHSLSQTIGRLRGRSWNCFSRCRALPSVAFRNFSEFQGFPWDLTSKILMYPLKSGFADLAEGLQSWSSKNMYVKVVNLLCLHIIPHTAAHPRPWLNRDQVKVWVSFRKQRNIS